MPSAASAKRPFTTTVSTRLVLFISTSGFPSSTTRSASLPGWTEPSSFVLLKSLAGFSVAVRSANYHNRECKGFGVNAS